MSERASREHGRKSKKVLRQEAILRSKIEHQEEKSSRSNHQIPERDDYTTTNILDCVRGQMM